ncbi:MAG: nicotinamide-nucleotide amidohydrolase family protein, partial [Candidatus Baltobacteraceae bacterium]
LQTQGLRIAVAESCTGGSLSTALTSVPGASKSFVGGVVAYDDAVKVRELGVSPAAIASFGAVSEAVALAMARGARERLGADLALSTTGIAGPSGGTPEKPVGLVWFGLSDAAGRERAWHALLRGDRETVVRRATTIGLGALWRHLTHQDP